MFSTLGENSRFRSARRQGSYGKRPSAVFNSFLSLYLQTVLFDVPYDVTKVAATLKTPNTVISKVAGGLLRVVEAPRGFQMLSVENRGAHLVVTEESVTERRLRTKRPGVTYPPTSSTGLRRIFSWVDSLDP
jgi:hypothetical protein